MRKAPDEKRREVMRLLCELMTLSGADNETVLAAINDPAFKDFEDAMQDCCAVDSKADYILTANIKDYARIRFAVNALVSAVPVGLLLLFGH